MPQDFRWLKQQGDKPEPRLEFIATLRRMRATSGRNIECCAYRVETGLEAADDVYADRDHRVAVVPRSECR